MGCRQVVRLLVLVQAFRGSNPCTPVSLFNIQGINVVHWAPSFIMAVPN
jgi:hypothetical protein